MGSSKVCEFAELLRTSGEGILQGGETLHLSDSLLKDLNDSFTFLNEADGDTSFQVTHMNTEVEMFCDIQFLHDFVQKVLKVRIVKDVHSNLDVPLSLSKFRNLRVLELKQVQAARIHGLQRLRTHLKMIVCSLSIHQLRDVLIRCGGDKSTVGGVWEDLVEASFTNNSLDTVDCSFQYTPWLQKIDLSYNNFKTFCVTTDLPNLKHLNLSFNILESIPTLSREASRKLEVLLLKNNYIKDLSGVSEFESVVELDVSCNSLQELPTLAALSHLTSLREVKLVGNPLSFHRKYRRNVIQQLHPNAVNLKVVLDGQPLKFNERSLVPRHRLTSPLGSLPACHAQPWSARQTEALSSVASIGSSVASGGTSSVVTGRRRVQVREACIREQQHTDADVRDAVEKEEVKTRKTALVKQIKVRSLRKESSPSSSFICTVPPTSMALATSPVSATSPASLASSPAPLASSPAPLATSPVSATSLALDISLDHATSPTHATPLVPPASPTPPVPATPPTPLVPPITANTFTPLVEPTPVSLPILSSPLLSPPLLPQSKSQGKKEKVMEEQVVADFTQMKVDISGLQEGLVFAAQCKESGGGDEEGPPVLLGLRGTDGKDKMEVEERDALNGVLKRRWPLDTLAHAEMLPNPSCSNHASSLVRLHMLSLQHQDFIMDTPDAKTLVRALCKGLSEQSLVELHQEEFCCLSCSTHFSREKPQHTFAGASGRPPGSIACPACRSRFVCGLPPAAPTTPVVSATAANPAAAATPAEAATPTAAATPAHVAENGSDGDSRDKIRNLNPQNLELLQPALTPRNEWATTNQDGDSGIGVASATSLQKEQEDSAHGQVIGQSREAEHKDAVRLSDTDCPAFFDVEPAPSLQEVFQGLLASVESRYCTPPAHENVDQELEGVCEDFVAEDGEVVQWRCDPTRVHHQLQLFAAQELLETDDDLLFAARASALPGGAAEPFPAVLLGSRARAFLLRVLGPCRGWPGDWLRREAAWTWKACTGRVRLLPWGQGVATPLPLPCGRPLLLVTQDTGAARRLQQLIKNSMVEAEGILVAEAEGVTDDDLWRRCPRLTPGKGTEKEEIDALEVPNFVSAFTECSLGAHETPSIVRWGCVLLMGDAELLLTAGDLRWLEPSPSYSGTVAIVARRPISDLLEVASGGGRVELRWGQGEAWVLSWEPVVGNGGDEEAVGGGGQALLRALRPSWENLFRVPLRTLPLS